jgi:histone chaperone ASF1
MSIVTLTNITVLDNPTKATNPFQFDITFECIAALAQDLEFKIIYVGSAEDDKYDQVLDAIMVGPVPPGINKFVFQADAPNFAAIPAAEVLGVTVVLIVCSYAGREFIRVGYYLNNEYESEEMRLSPPETPSMEHVVRNILADKPRVTKIPIQWDDQIDPEAVPPPEWQQAEAENSHQEEEEEEQEEEEEDDDEMEEPESEESDAEFEEQVLMAE